jgi:hypothetical protein
METTRTPMSETEYLSFREKLEQLQRESETSLDKAVLTLSGGALALSLTFLTNTSVAPDLVSRLNTSWTLLVVALLSSLLSYQTSAFAMETAIRRLDRGRESGTYPTIANFWDWLTFAFNSVAVLSLIVGVFFLVSYAVATLRVQ